MIKILIIDDEAPIRDVMSASLKDEGYEVETASDGENGLKKLREFQPQMAFLDIWMPGRMDGIEVLNQARKEFPHVEFVMISGHGTIETAVKATKLGAWDFIEKPLSMDKINIVITNVIHYLQEKNDKSSLLNKLRKSIALIGDSQAAVNIKQIIARVAPMNAWLIISGEYGSGKELAAQNIHYMSHRAGRPFVDLNCASLPEELLEAEIFGLEKGALPGVDKIRKGKVELAAGGTLYLEEILDANPQVQQKLLKLLLEKKFQRVGGTEWIDVDVRVIGSTSKDFVKAIEEKRFSLDLYQRMNVNPFPIEPLRNRSEDIQTLLSYFADSISRQSGEPKKVFSEKAIEILKKYNWPGNIRELKNFVERVYILTPGEFIDVHDLRFAGLGEGASSDFSSMTTFREARAEFEKQYLVKKIQENNGNISKTAEVIGLERSYLHRKIKAYGIEVS